MINGNNERLGVITILVTNITKLVGVALALNEGLQDQVDARVLAVAAFLAAGAQGLESLVERLLTTGKGKDE